MNRIATSSKKNHDPVQLQSVAMDNSPLMQYEKMINNVSVAFAMVDRNYCYLAANDFFLKAFFTTREALIGTHMREHLGAYFYQEISKPNLDKALAGESQTFRGWVQQPDNSKFYLEINFIPNFDEDGNVISVITSAVDITDMKKKEMMLNRYEQIVNSVSDHITFVNDDFVYEAVNQKFLDAFGKTRDQVIGHSSLEVVGKENFERIAKPNYERTLAGEEFRIKSWSLQNVVGRRYMDFRYFPFYEEGKSDVAGAVMIGQDITDTYQAEINLDLYNAILNEASDYLTIIDKDFRYLVVNEKFAASLGKTIDEMLGAHIEEIMGVERFAGLSKPNIEKAIETGYSSANTWVNHASLGRRYVDIEYTTHKDADGELQCILITGHDITELKEAQMVLEQREQELGEAQRIARLGLWKWDLKTNEMQVSPEITALMCNDEYDAEWFRDMENSKTLFHPEDAQRVEETIEKSFSLGIPYEIEHRIIWPDGQVRHLQVQATMEFEAGEPSHMVGTTLDITKIKEAENEVIQLNEELEERVKTRTNQLQKANISLNASLLELKDAQNQLIQSEKMASLGGLVAGVAHEINTPIGMCVSTASFLKDKFRKWTTLYDKEELTREDFEELMATSKESLDILLNNLNRSGDLVRSFKQVAVDRSSEQPRQIFLQSYITEVLQSLNPEFKHKEHKITLDCSEHIQSSTYPGAISQILTNLLMNSLNHGFEDTDKGQIDIQVTEKDDKINIVYQDNGKGLTDEVKSKIFEPFFTTSRAKGGSGLGMHIVFNLVNQTLNGTIDCDGAPGKGVIFTISIPANIDSQEIYT